MLEPEVAVLEHGAGHPRKDFEAERLELARHSTDDEFDIDVMADITYRPDVDPEDALATLHGAIRGAPGSRYHKKTTRKTRCITVQYDGMHLDVAPTARLAGTIEKTGKIFHSKPEEPRAKKTLLANPHGFAQWFISKTPADQDFGAFFERRSLDYDRTRLAGSEGPQKPS